MSADVVFLGVSRPGHTGIRGLSKYWHETVGNTNAKQVYPVHWDDPTEPLTAPVRTTPLVVDHSVATVRRLRDITHAHCGRMHILPIRVQIPLYRHARESIEEAKLTGNCEAILTGTGN